MAGDPRCVPALLSCGLRELSVNPSALAQIKQTIDGLSQRGHPWLKRRSTKPGKSSAVAEYKRIFKEVLDSRPSGMRIRLAHAMGKNRSFVSQISNPAYPVPIPVQHLNTIFDVCHFPPAAKDAFLRAYARAHPRRLGQLSEGAARSGASRCICRISAAPRKRTSSMRCCRNLRDD